ncbi:glycosyltransferase family 4 protein [Butyrivibrio sp. WCD2001]|uniref:glycosyltransferase family 4 protein n=1 Tax=Butyrivibrio sp. WCD2001 TaxID=1280681 RepID=UPI000403B475|nr:glycosyltransferase family 1 protein [Butyrivibrio sp. WCD2001]
MTTSTINNSNNDKKSIQPKLPIPARITEFILTLYPVIGLIIAVTLRLCSVQRPYYALMTMALAFVLLTFLTNKIPPLRHRKTPESGTNLHLREFVVRYWMLTLTAILCLLYQALHLGRSARTLISGLTLYLLVYSGFLYGKKYAKRPGRTLQILAVLLAVTSIVGIIWWVQCTFPPIAISEEAAKYFISAPHRMVSVYIHPIIAATFMLLLVSIVIFSLGEKFNRSIPDNIIRFILLFIGIAGIYASFTRSAYLVLAALPILLLLRLRNNKNRTTNAIGTTANLSINQNTTNQSGKKPLPTVTKILLIAITVILVLTLLYITGVAGTIYERFFGTNWREDPSYTFRIDTLKVTADSMREEGIGRFLFGRGQGKGDNILKETTWLIEKYEVIPAIDNSFSTMLLDHGIFAFILFAAQLLIVLKNSLKSRNLIYYLLLPQLVMAITFDAQTWPGTEFMLFVMIGIEMAGRRYPHPGFSKDRPLIISGRIFAQPVTGVQRYGIEIIKQIDKMVEPGEAILALPQGELVTTPDFKNIELAVIGKGNGNKWTQIYLPLFAYKKRGTILTLAGIAPAIKPDYVATHDISFMRYPDSYGKAFRLMYRWGYLITLYRCKGIITISEFSRDELIAFYELDEDRFTIAGNSAEQILENSRLQSTPENRESDNSHENSKSQNTIEENATTPITTDDINTLAKWGLSPTDPYYLSVGSKNLHKNQKFIKKLAKKYPDRKFVVAGGSAARSFGSSGDMTIDDTENSVPAGTTPGKVPHNLILTGYISDEDLLTLYAYAHAFIFPSLYEGFGIPPMEAILSGVKHIALADIPVLREIYTKGCYFFDPKNINAFDIDTLNNEKDCITEEDRNFYIKTYSWKNSAKRILGAIK